MALNTNFKQVNLSGLDINNPTSIQFGPDGRLYVSQQNGIIKIAEIQAVTDTQGAITGYEVIGQVETINLIQDIPNHDDNGDLNLSIDQRQVTGLVVDSDAEGNIVLYVSSSDPRIGAKEEGTDKNLDTNSGIISRLTLTDPSAPLGDERWSKVDLVIGLPRSEENHSTNGMDIRTEIVDGEEHQIMYVASGGNTNRGAPSNNFAWTPEYYYSTAVLRVDLTKLEQIEASEGLKGGTEYVDAYVYALPTLNDPTRADDAQGRDTAAGTTGEQDAEAADTFGGNDGLNQAKYDPNGIVQIYSTGYRNHYDVVITEAGNIYTFDNGPNNGWGDVPLTAEGVPVKNSNQVGTNIPNIDVDTGSDTDPDNLHLVTEGFYAGHPHPVYASGADAGLYRVDTSSGSPVVTKLTDPSDPNNDPTTTADDLPSDWDTISGGITHPGADIYKAPGSDGSLLSIGSSSNGLTEYTASGISDNPNAEILAVAPFNGKVTFIEIESNGTQEGTQVTDTKQVAVSGLPLDLTAVGNDGIDGSGLFAGTVWLTQFGANGIAVLTPGTPPAPDLDQDDDGLEDNIDPLQYDSANGINTVLNAGETLFWDFNPADSGKNPSKGTSSEGPYNVGLTGWMIDGVNYLDDLTNLDNTIRGGAPGVIQVKNVGSGALVGLNNTQKDAIQTGFLPAPEVKAFTIKVPIFNPLSSNPNWTGSASVGFTLGDGSMSNFIQIAVTGLNQSGSDAAANVKVTYEENDTFTELEIDANELLDAVSSDLVELFLDVNMATYEVTPSWRFQTNGVWSEIEQVGNSPIQLDVDGQIVKALKGELYIDGLQSASVVSLTSSSDSSEQFSANFLDLTIESTAAFPDVLIQETKGNTKVIEGGSSDTYSLVLMTQPTSEVKVTLSPDAQITLDRTEVVFTPANWNIPQIINISAVDDTSLEDKQEVTIAHSVISEDPDYDGKSVSDLSIDVIDNDGPQVLYRINVGGKAIAAADGSLGWSADTDTNPSPYRVGSGGSNIYATNANIDTTDASLPAGVPEALFQTERFDPIAGENMKWAFDVESGDYEVRLYMAEIYAPIDLEGERVFDVAVEGSVPTVFDNIDSIANVEPQAGFMLAHTATVTDGTLNLEFLHDTENPALKGIEVLAINDNDATVNADILYRINVGGQEVVATDGSLAWSADTDTNPSPYRVGSGGSNIYTTDANIDTTDASLPAGVPEALFQTERFDPIAGENMKWAFDVESGDYEVRLYMAEIYAPIDLEGERVFDVAVEGSVPTVFDNIDPIANVEPQAGFMLAHTATVTDGTLNLEFLHDTENPALKGIEILSVPTDDHDGGSTPIEPTSPNGDDDSSQGSGSENPTDDHDGGSTPIEPTSPNGDDDPSQGSGSENPTDDHDGGSTPIEPTSPNGDDDPSQGSGSENPTDDHDGGSTPIEPTSPNGDDDPSQGSGSENPTDDHDGGSTPIEPTSPNGDDDPSQGSGNDNPTSLNLTGGTAQIAYVAYYGRPGDNSGLEFWNGILTEKDLNYDPRQGDRLTDGEADIYNRIVDDFGNSAEADRLFGGFSSNREKVNQVYQFAFNRDGDKEGLDYWTDQIDRNNVTLASFALEVALGAQNSDIDVLYNKIESADLFTSGIDTPAEINAYRGGEAEIFGRNWLSNYGLTISTVAEVDWAMNELVG